MTTTWINTLMDVGSAGNITQLYPASATAGSGGTTAGTERRRPTAGTLYTAQVYTPGGAGGIIQLWDVAGLTEGVSNNVDTGTAMTNAYVAAEIAAGRGRLIWEQEIAGSAGASKSLIVIPIPFVRGLAARYYTSGGPGADTAKINISADGGFFKAPISG
jgi:hypothetical protein